MGKWGLHELTTKQQARQNIMNKNFDKCLSMLLEHEGGYVNHPSDPGGMTNMGITKRTYDDFYDTDITEEGMRQLSTADVEPIYKQNYWLKCQCHELPSGVDWAVFDWAVNSGPARAAKALQRAVGASTDGVIGPQTLAAAKAVDRINIINRMAMYREQFYRSLSTFDTFGKGWSRRNDETREQAIAMG
jgi:lysozyme family protein